MHAAERAILRDGVAIGLAVGVIGASFGVLARAAGVSAPMTCGMSLLVFAGGSQFLAIAIVSAKGSLFTAVTAGLLLNARHIPFGLSLARVLEGGLGKRLLASQVVIDESTAFALSQPSRPLARRAFYTVGITLFICWQVGTAAGAFAGGVIGDPTAAGIDAAFPAGLLALLAPRLDRVETRVAAIVGAVLALAFTPVLPAGAPILVAGLGVPAGFWVGARR
jgi:branched chain amino acid efflux pump